MKTAAKRPKGLVAAACCALGWPFLEWAQNTAPLALRHSSGTLGTNSINLFFWVCIGNIAYTHLPLGAAWFLCEEPPETEQLPTRKPGV
jgi:hypothetical protein